MSCLRKQSTGDVSVEVNACPGPDLRQILEDLRCQYETLIARNRKEVEDWYECKVSETLVLQTRVTHTAPSPGAFQRPDIETISSSSLPVKPESSTHYALCYRRHRPVRPVCYAPSGTAAFTLWCVVGTEIFHIWIKGI